VVLPAVSSANVRGFWGTAVCGSKCVFILFVRGLGTLLGSPVAGQLRGSGGVGEGVGAYAKAMCWDGALLMAATVYRVGVM
jgi:hypothetical protein